jgi:hypothetical protein
MNMRPPHPYLEPTPICASFAAILPVLDEPGIDARQAAEARAHLATCAYCQAQVAGYYRLETAMRRALGPSGTPRPRTEDIMSELLHEKSGEQPALEAATPLKPAPRAPRPGRTRRFISGLAALAAVLVVAILAAGIFATHPHSTPGTTSTTSTPTVIAPTPGTQSGLNDVAMVSASEGWAVGYREVGDSASGQQQTAMLLHYAHGAWTQFLTPIQGYSVQLNSISMLSPTDGWAAGYQEISGQSSQTILLHYNGHTWASIANNVPGGIAHLQMLSDTDGYALGGTSLSDILHYDGHNWTVQPLPSSLGAGTSNAVQMSDLFMLSPTDGWAVGSMNPILSGRQTSASDLPSGLILHYTGGQWTLAQTIPNAELGHIALASASDGWASGSNITPFPNAVGFTQSALLLQYANGRWAAVASPTTNAAGYGKLFQRPHTDAWMIADQNVAPDPQPTLLQDLGGGLWAINVLPEIQDAQSYTFSSVFMTSPKEGWLVGTVTLKPNQSGQSSPTPGFSYAPLETSALILHDHNGVWSMVQG